MKKAKYCFEAGFLVGRLEGAIRLTPNDPRIDYLKNDIVKALASIGINVSVDNLAHLSRLSNEVKKICDKKESAFFELGADIIPLQTYLKIISLSNLSDLSDNNLVDIASVLKPLIHQIRLHLADIGALDIAGPFLGKFEKEFSNPQGLKYSSAELFKEVDIFKAQLEAWIIDNSEKSVKNNSEKITNAGGDKINIHIHDLVKDSGKSEVKVKQKTKIDINIKVDLPAIQSDLRKFKREAAKLDDNLKEEIEEIEDDLLAITPNSEQSKINKAINRLSSFMQELGDENSKFNKIVKGSEKAVDMAQKLGKTYNKFAQWLALPQVPDLFLEK